MTRGWVCALAVALAGASLIAGCGEASSSNASGGRTVTVFVASGARARSAPTAPAGSPVGVSTAKRSTPHVPAAGAGRVLKTRAASSTPKSSTASGAVGSAPVGSPSGRRPGLGSPSSGANRASSEAPSSYGGLAVCKGRARAKHRLTAKQKDKARELCAKLLRY